MAKFKDKAAIENPRDSTLASVAERYTVRVTSAILDRITDKSDPVALQYLPDPSELVTSPEEKADPIGDNTHSPVKGIIHRYPDRVLLMPVAVCAVYCRFCFRREKVGQGEKALTDQEIEAALDYIRSQSKIYEVILSGGDPLILSPRRLGAILKHLEEIPHVQVIRIHSRVPVADPERITEELCDTLKRQKAMYVSVHVNHVQEIGQAAEAGFIRLQQAGCVLLSQTVLLKDVNDNAQALENLFRRLVALKIKPYYLHHPDLAPGTGHFRLPVQKGQTLMAELRGKLSGLAQPTYVLDIPGGFGKVPVGPSYIETETENDCGCVITDPTGRKHLYPPSGSTD